MFGKLDQKTNVVWKECHRSVTYQGRHWGCFPARCMAGPGLQLGRPGCRASWWVLGSVGSLLSRCCGHQAGYSVTNFVLLFCCDDSEIYHVCNNDVFLFREGGSPGKNNQEVM